MVNYIEGTPLVLFQGENKPLSFWLTNSGSKAIGEVWMVSGADDEIWVGVADDSENCECTYIL